MSISPESFRRWLGAFFLTAAVGMLVLGQTVWESRLKEFHFILYWVICFTFTGLAALTALWDAMIVHRQSRAAQRQLLSETLAEAKRKSGRARTEIKGRPLREPKWPP